MYIGKNWKILENRPKNTVKYLKKPNKNKSYVCENVYKCFVLVQFKPRFKIPNDTEIQQKFP